MQVDLAELASFSRTGDRGGRRADAVTAVNATIALGDDVTCRVCTLPSPDDADALAGVAAELAAGDGESA